MKAEIKVPAMGESISEATVGQILKPSGSGVQADDEILELETDKVNQVLYAPQAGTINLSVAAGDVVAIGQVIGTVDTDAAAAPQETKSEKKEEAPPPPQQQPSPQPVLQPPGKSQKAPEGGSARRGKEAFIAGLGKGDSQGQKQPESQAAPKPQPESKAKEPQKPQQQPKINERETRRKMSRVRKVIAERLVQAQQSTAMLTTFNEVDMTQVIALREKYKDQFSKEHGVKLGFMSFFVKASVSALEAFPDFNSYIDGDDIVHREYYDIGVAVGTEKGLFVPVVRNANHLTYAGIESAIEGFAKKAREGGLVVDDLQGGGFTITNGGVYGSLLSTPILNLPQCGILGMHKIEKRPMVINDQIVIRPMMYLALSYDHRIVDGKEAVSFLVHIKNMLEDSARLLLEV